MAPLGPQQNFLPKSFLEFLRRRAIRNSRVARILPILPRVSRVAKAYDRVRLRHQNQCRHELARRIEVHLQHSRNARDDEDQPDQADPDSESSSAFMPMLASDSWLNV